MILFAILWKQHTLYLFCSPSDQTSDIFPLKNRPFGLAADPPVYFTIENGPFGLTDHRTSMTLVPILFATAILEERSTRNDFVEFKFLVIFNTINCALNHLITLNIPSYLFSGNFVPN